MSLKKGLQKSTNYASKIPQPIFPNSPVIYELETRTFQQKSVLNCSQNCFSQNSLPDFSKSARSVQKSQPFTTLKRVLKKLEKCSQESLKTEQGKVTQFACKTVLPMSASSKNRATSKINSGQPRMSFETLNISNESTNLVLSPVKTVFKNSN